MPPKTLLGRDHRNDEHVKQALTIIDELGKFQMMEATIAGLRASNIPIPPTTKSLRKVVKGTIAVGTSYLLEVGMYFPDNVIRQCNICRAPLQFRPNVGYSLATFLCIFCTADRLLNNYWDRQAKRRRK
jgi:hypothetical protein